MSLCSKVWLFDHLRYYDITFKTATKKDKLLDLLINKNPAYAFCGMKIKDLKEYAATIDPELKSKKRMEILKRLIKHHKMHKITKKAEKKESKKKDKKASKKDKKRKPGKVKPSQEFIIKKTDNKRKPVKRGKKGKCLIKSNKVADLQKCTVKEIRKELKELNKPVSGLKKDIIFKLIQARKEKGEGARPSLKKKKQEDDDIFKTIMKKHAGNKSLGLLTLKDIKKIANYNKMRNNKPKLNRLFIPQLEKMGFDTKNDPVNLEKAKDIYMQQWEIFLKMGPFYKSSIKLNREQKNELKNAFSDRRKSPEFTADELKKLAALNYKNDPVTPDTKLAGAQLAYLGAKIKYQKDMNDYMQRYTHEWLNVHGENKKNRR